MRDSENGKKSVSVHVVVVDRGIGIGSKHVNNINLVKHSHCEKPVYGFDDEVDMQIH